MLKAPVSSWGMNPPVRVAFFFVAWAAMSAVGCGGRATSRGGLSSDAATAPSSDASSETSADASSETSDDAEDAGVAAEAGGDTGAPPSCAPGGPGMSNCGLGGSGTESCCTSLEVTGGTYYRTYDDDSMNLVPPDGGPPTDEADPAAVSSFRLDKYLVTVGRFRQFMSAVSPPDGGAGWLPVAGSGKHTGGRKPAAGVPVGRHRRGSLQRRADRSRWRVRLH